MAKSKWQVTIEEKGDDVKITWEGDSKSIPQIHAVETLLKILTSFDADSPFTDGKAPKKTKRTWDLPLKSRRIRRNGKTAGKKGKKHDVPEEAVELYRMFNGCEPDQLKQMEIWLPDDETPLVAIGEGDCPFIGYSSAKDSPDGSIENYIHHFGEEGGKKPRVFVTMPPKGYKKMMVIIGGDWDIEKRGEKLWLVD